MIYRCTSLLFNNLDSEQLPLHLAASLLFSDDEDRATCHSHEISQ